MLVLNRDSFKASKANAAKTFFSATTEFVNPRHDLMDLTVYLLLIMSIMHDENQLCRKHEGQHNDSWITSCFWAATSKGERIAGDWDSDFLKDHRGIQRY